jgi:hypothetical protein
MKIKKILLLGVTCLIFSATCSCSSTKPLTESKIQGEEKIAKSKSVPTNDLTPSIPVNQEDLVRVKSIQQQMISNGKCIDISNNSNNAIEDLQNVTLIINCGNIMVNNFYFFKPEIDGKGHKFQMVIKILARHHQWRLASIKELEGTNQGLSILKGNELTTKAEKELVSAFSTQIVVGTASREGDAIQEKQRAYERAVEIGKFISNNYDAKPKYLLNLGRFEDGKCKDKYYHEAVSTKFQRPVIIMSILRDDGSPEPEQKQVEKMVKNSLDSLGFGLSYQCYSNFNLVDF